MATTLFEYDTEIYADSVEAIPNSTKCYFLSGTYQLDEASRTRKGRVTLHQLSGEDNHVETFEHVDTSGILDMKFNPDQIGEKHTLALALSDGYLSLLPLDLSDVKHNVWKDEEKLLIEDESTICLSVDWSNQMIADPNPMIAVSLSNGMMSVCQYRDGSYEVVNKWNAHTLPYTTVPAEVWITSFDPQNSSIVYSGGDDGVMKQWDLRAIGSYACPTNTCKRFDAGVTSMCWNKYDADFITVGSYDGHVRIFDKRNIVSPVCDYDVQNNAGIWRIKYKHNCNYFLPHQNNDVTRNEVLLAAMRAGFVVMNYDEQKQLTPLVTYLAQGTESLAYGVDYIYKEGEDLNEKNGFAGSCSFYNHLMHVWKYDY